MKRTFTEIVVRVGKNKKPVSIRVEKRKAFAIASRLEAKHRLTVLSKR